MNSSNMRKVQTSSTTPLSTIKIKISDPPPPPCSKDFSKILTITPPPHPPKLEGGVHAMISFVVEVTFKEDFSLEKQKIYYQFCDFKI